METNLGAGSLSPRPTATSIVVLASHGANFFVYSIALAVAVRSARRPESDCSPSPTVRLIWLMHRNISAGQYARNIMRRLAQRFYRLYQVLRSFRARFSRHSAEQSQPGALLHRVQNGETVFLERFGVVIEGRFIDTGPVAARLDEVRATARILRLKLHGAGDFQKALLQTTVKDIPAGDLVASTSLTRTPRLATGVAPIFGLSRFLARAEGIVRGAQKARLGRVDYAMSAEPTYLQMLGPRIFEALGAQALLGTRSDAIAPSSALLQPSRSGKSMIRLQMAVSRAPGSVPCTTTCSHLDRVRSRIDLLSDRVTGDVPSGLKDLCSESESVAVVFMHDFSDGQFLYGYDRFGELESWVFAVVDTALEETNSSVVLKTHSIVKPTYKALNLNAVNAIADRYLGNPRVHLLRAAVSLSCINDALEGVPWFGITKHGTVAEELPLLGHSCLASRLGPWGDSFRFAWMYEDRDELAELLRAGSDLGLVPNWQQELCAYVQDRYASEVRNDLKGDGPHAVARFVDSARGYASNELHSMEEWERSNAFLQGASSEDPILVRAIEEVARAKNVQVPRA